MKASLAISFSALVASALAQARNFTTIEPSGSYNPAAATAIQTVYPKQHHYVKGRVVDHIWHLILDNADYDAAVGNSDFQALAQHGILLDNYYALAHPAQANYLGIVGGDTFGLEEERFVALPSNVSTIVESLENQRVLWAQYTEDQPFTAYPGWTYGDSYSRAKNPLVAFDSIVDEPRRLVNLKSWATFEQDLISGHMPQWLLLRPNLQNDGTNSDLSTALSFARNLLEPYATDKKKYHRKLFILTFAHSSSTDGRNRVPTLILGDMHKKERGTTDSTYFDHYSIISSTQANYDLPSLGRYDCSANVFPVINSKAKHNNIDKPADSLPSDYNSGVSSGYLSSIFNPLPIPNVNCEGAGRAGVLGRVKKLWKKTSYSYYQWTFNY